MISKNKLLAQMAVLQTDGRYHAETIQACMDLVNAQPEASTEVKWHLFHEGMGMIHAVRFLLDEVQDDILICATDMIKEAVGDD